MPKKRGQPGCPCCGEVIYDYEFTVRVKGCCNLYLPDAEVEIFQGTTSYGTGTTDSSGEVTFTGLPSIADWRIVVDDGEGHFEIDDSEWNTVGSIVDITLDPADGRECLIGPRTWELGGSPTLIDPLGNSISLTYGGGGTWTGSRSYTVSSRFPDLCGTAAWYVGNTFIGCSTGTGKVHNSTHGGGTVGIDFEVSVGCSGATVVMRFWTFRCAGPGEPFGCSNGEYRGDYLIGTGSAQGFFAAAPAGGSGIGYCGPSRDFAVVANVTAWPSFTPALHYAAGRSGVVSGSDATTGVIYIDDSDPYTGTMGDCSDKLHWTATGSGTWTLNV